MIAESIQMVHQGNYLSKYIISYRDERTNEITPYEIVSKQGSLFNNSLPLTLESLGEKIPAVIVIVFNPTHDKILLNKEFRLGINKTIYSTTAGLIDSNEAPEETAKRELFEETGLTLTKIIRKLPNSYPCAPVSDDFLPTFICEAEGEIQDSKDPREIIHPGWYTKQEVYKLVTDEKCAFSSQMQMFAYMWSTSFIN